MAIFYSASNRGFYHSDIHGDNIPEDAKQITEDLHRELIEGQSNGKVISVNTRGRPVLKDPTPPTTAEQNALDNAVILKQIKEIETAQQPRAIRDVLLSNDNTRLLAIDKQIQELRAQLK